MEVALVHLQKKREIIAKAAQMICTYLDIDFESFLHYRPNGDLTIYYMMDPIQFMIPVPKKSKVIEVMEKDLAAQLLEWLIDQTVQKFKDNAEVVPCLHRY